MPSLRVLVVDDSAITRVATAELLQAAGHRVTQVRSGERAVRQAGEEIFDVVLMDMRMQGMHGLDAARHIRALPGRHGRTPIIAVTAELAAAERAAWQAAGIDDYLGKPCDQAQLLHAIRRVTATREAGIPRPESLPRQTAPQRHLRMLSQELHAMLSLLDTPARDLDSGALDALVHRIAGDSAQLGFAAVATECRRFEQAIRTVADRPAPHDALTQATRAAIAELRQRLQDPRNGEARSAMPV